MEGTALKKIIVSNLKYRYPNSNVLALNDLSFSVEEGEFVSIIGKNRSGKSTLCQALVGLVPHFYRGAYGGSVIIDGVEVAKAEISELAMRVGIVFQNPFTQITGSKLTVYEEIAFGLENMGLSHHEMVARIEYALDLLNIDTYRNRNPFTLSGGQMQRLAIASMIAMKPQVIILDEPTSQLDPQGTEEVFKAIQNLAQKGMTVIMVEHKMESIAEYSDKIMLMNEGKILAFDSPAKVFSELAQQTKEVNPPSYTRICQALNLKEKSTGLYPVTISQACRVLLGE